MSPGTPQRPVSLKQSYQATRRALASARGDCIVCCKRPRARGTRCLECAELRANEASRKGRVIVKRTGRKKTRKQIHADHYRKLRAAGICNRCRGPGAVRHVRCPACRRSVAAQLSARRAVLPVAAPGSQGRGELSRIGKSKDNASGEVSL